MASLLVALFSPIHLVSSAVSAFTNILEKHLIPPTLKTKCSTLRWHWKLTYRFEQYITTQGLFTVTVVDAPPEARIVPELSFHSCQKIFYDT